MTEADRARALELLTWSEVLDSVRITFEDFQSQREEENREDNLKAA